MLLRTVELAAVCVERKISYDLKIRMKAVGRLAGWYNRTMLDTRLQISVWLV